MRRLRIAVDAHRLVCQPLTSGATYLDALVREWQASENAPELDLLVPYRPPDAFAQQAPYTNSGVRLVYPTQPGNPILRYREQALWQQRSIPALLRQHRPDVYFSPFHFTPQLPLGLRMVTAIHDLCFLGEPFFSLGHIINRVEMYSACIRSRRLICVSEFTAEMLARWAPRAARRSTVVHNGLSGKTLPMEEAKELLRSLSPDLVPQEYLLWIGHLTFRKNPELLFDIFAAYHQRFPTHKFVVVALRAAHDELQNLARARGLESALRVFSAVENKTRDAIYRCALALVFPSRCEGFGFPVLEAMYQGCPAFASRKGPAREMVGGLLPMAAGLTVEAFMTALGRYLAMSGSERQDLSAALIARASNFSSKAMAAGTLKVLQAAAGRIA